MRPGSGVGRAVARSEDDMTLYLNRSTKAFGDFGSFKDENADCRI